MPYNKENYQTYSEKEKLLEQLAESELEAQRRREEEEENEEEMNRRRDDLARRAKALAELGEKAESRLNLMNGEVDIAPGVEVSVTDIQKNRAPSPDIDWNGEALSANITVNVGGQEINLGRLSFQYGEQHRSSLIDGQWREWGSKLDVSENNPVMAKLQGLEKAGKIQSVKKVIKKIESALDKEVPLQMGFSLSDIDPLTSIGKSMIKKAMDDNDNIHATGPDSPSLSMN